MEQITLKIELTPKQSIAHSHWVDPRTLFLLFGGGAGGGKSFWIASEQIIQAYQYPGIKSFIARKELKRLMESTYLTFVKACSFYGVPRDDWKLNGQYNYIEFRNGSRIDLLDINFIPSDPLYERFGSTEFTNGFIEEGGEAEFGAFDVLKSRVGRHRNTEFGLVGKLGITANPTKNWLYRVFYQPWKAKALMPEYAFVQSLYGDNPFTADTYGVQLSHMTDMVQKERLMFGNWDYESDQNTLINYDAIMDLFTNTVDETGRFITADIARFGKDKTRIGYWEGYNLKEVITKEQQGIDRTITDIRTLAANNRVPYSQIAIDEDGIGGGVVDGMRGVRGFIANSAPLDEAGQKVNYKNLKAQCSYRLADKINGHEVAVTAELSESDRQQLVEDLGWIKSKDADKDGKRMIMPKDEVKEHLGRSPDLGDMVMMRMLFDVKQFGGKMRVNIPRPHRYGATVNPQSPPPRENPLVNAPYVGWSQPVYTPPLPEWNGGIAFDPPSGR